MYSEEEEEEALCEACKKLEKDPKVPQRFLEQYDDLEVDEHFQYGYGENGLRRE